MRISKERRISRGGRGRQWVMLRAVHPRVRLLKRLVDVVGSISGLAVTLPLYVPIAAAIRAESPGPIFYVQRRAGRLIDPSNGGRWDEFDMFKFRSMANDAE